ncbi:hypothetical protein LIER_27713 [Lithospermum erythrorhizon]|uniref:RNase H type-1 domain-containing protein n=1 Tax=Lithospermum erythrorhizon TaxID=34254 RepID=A0AAV3RGN4_LITER
MNLALLAKQGYFWHSSFLNAKVGSRPSFGWRSLLEGRKVLLKGTRWRVGDGRSIDMWKEQWLPRVSDFFLRGERGDKPKWVSQLIQGGEWSREAMERAVEGEDVGLWYSSPWMLVTSNGPWRSFQEWCLFLVNKLKDHKDGKLLTNQIGERLLGRCRAGNGASMVPDQPQSIDDIEHRWRPPATNMIKVNCDAGWHKESRTGSLGVVIRDDRGLFNGAFFKQIQHVDSPLVAEALAIREGLHFA